MAYGARLLIWHRASARSRSRSPVCRRPTFRGAGQAPGPRHYERIREHHDHAGSYEAGLLGLPGSTVRGRHQINYPLPVRPADARGGRRPKRSAEPARSRRVSGALMGSYCGTFLLYDVKRDRS
jgi:hypothetical protein